MTRRLELDKIKKDDRTFLRKEGYDRDAIERYKEKYKSGSTKPLILQKKSNILIDGYHRLKALQELGREATVVKKIDVPDEDLRAEANRRNADAKVPLSREERNRQISELYWEDNKTQKEIGEIFNLSRRRVGQILESLGMEASSKTKESKTGDKRVELNEEERAEVIGKCFEGGVTQKEIAKEYGISEGRVSQLKKDFKDEVHKEYKKGMAIESILEDTDVDVEKGEVVRFLAEYEDIPPCLVKEGDIELDACRVEFRDAIAALSELEDGSVDCVIMDPPYGINFSSSRYKNADFEEMANDDDMEVAVNALERIGRILKEDSHAYVFTRWDVYPFMVQHIPPGLELSNLLVWDKGRGGHGMGDLDNYAPRYELIMLLEKGDREIRGKRSPNVLTFKDIRFTDEEKYHPTQKPVALVKFLVKKSTEEGELILDPFLGSGTTAVASLSEGRRFLGFEVDGKYVRAIKRRILRVISSV